MAILEDQFGNVAVHGEATCASGVDFGVIPLEVYAIKFFPFEVLYDGVMGGEDSSEVVKVLVTYILNAKIINNENKHDGAPFVAPKSWRGSRLVVTIVVKACVE